MKIEIERQYCKYCRTTLPCKNNCLRIMKPKKFVFDWTGTASFKADSSSISHRLAMFYASDTTASDFDEEELE